MWVTNKVYAVSTVTLLLSPVRASQDWKLGELFILFYSTCILHLWNIGGLNYFRAAMLASSSRWAWRESWIMKQESGRWRTCKVASYLQGQSGIPEWCENTQPIALFLAGHDKEHTKSIDSKSCRSEMIKVSKSAIETLKFLKLPVLSSLSRNEVFLLREVPEPLQLHHVRGSQLHGGPHPRPCRQTHQQYPNKEAESTKPLVQSKKNE